MPLGLSYKDYKCSMAADNRCDHSLSDNEDHVMGVSYFINIFTITDLDMENDL